jgi:DNA-binding MarR family transcriptional regulator
MDRVASVRAFNRFYTGRIGALREGLGLDGSGYGLTEARILYELAQRDVTEVADLRAALGVDAGYLSRLLTRLERDGLLERRRSEADGRRQHTHLTEKGAAAFARLDALAAADAGALLDRLDDEEQRRLVAAMETIRAALEPADPAPRAFVLRPPAPGDLGWIVQRHGALYASEYGWNVEMEGLVAGVVADYAAANDPAREAVWIAEVDGERAGCVMCVASPDDPRVARLRLLLVEPRARGLGLGGRLVDECVRFARSARYEELTLWTNDVLADARRIYERAGFVLTRSRPHRSFGHDLVGQDWTLKL